MLVVTRSNTLHKKECRYAKTALEVETIPPGVKTCKVCNPNTEEIPEMEESYYEGEEALEQEIEENIFSNWHRPVVVTLLVRPEWAPRFVDAAPRDVQVLRKEGLFAAIDYNFALRGWASSGIKPVVAATRDYEQDILLLVKQFKFLIRVAQQAWNEAWDAHVMKARNAEKALKNQRSREWAQQETLRRKAAQERAAKAKARLAARKAREEAAFLNWQEQQSWLDVFPWLKNSCFWNVRKADDPSSWGALTEQVDQKLAAFNKAVREARAAGRAYAQGKAAARKARRLAHAGLGGGKCEVKPSAKKKAWQKGEKRALKSLLRRQRKAAMQKTQVLVVKVTKEVTRVIPMTRDYKALIKSLKVQATIARKSLVELQGELASSEMATLHNVAVYRQEVAQATEKALDTQASLFAVESKLVQMTAAIAVVVTAQESGKPNTMTVIPYSTEVVPVIQLPVKPYTRKKTIDDKMVALKDTYWSNVSGGNVTALASDIGTKLAAQVEAARVVANKALADYHRAVRALKRAEKDREEFVNATRPESEAEIARLREEISGIEPQILAVYNNRGLETVTVTRLERISKKELKANKKTETVTASLGRFNANPPEMVEISMGKMSSAVAGTVPVAVKANA